MTFHIPTPSIVAKVLVVDDEPQILSSTASLLEAVGHSVVATSDHREVVRLLLRERVDVLLQDVRMPGLDIAQLVRAVRAEALVAATPIILFSASLDLVETKEEVGATEYLEKPFRPSELFAAIGRATTSIPVAAVGA